MKLHGVIAPLTTPFEDDRVAPDLLRANLALYEAAGLHGYLLFGSSGEAPLLTEAEKIELLAAARSAVPPGKPLIVGVGRESTAETIRLCRIAADGGADLLLVLTPHYYRGQMDGETLARYFVDVAEGSSLPTLLYSVPRFTGVEIPLATVVALSRHERIVGIKDSAGDLDRLAQLQAETGPGFRVLCGSHGICVDAFERGIDGAILAAANPFARTYRRIHGLAAGGDLAAARELANRVGSVSALAVSTLGVAGIKAAMDLCGFHGGSPRPPLLSIAEDGLRELRQQIEALDAAGVSVAAG